MQLVHLNYNNFKQGYMFLSYAISVSEVICFMDTTCRLKHDKNT